MEEKKYQQIGVVRMRSGLTLWEVDLLNKTIQKAPEEEYTHPEAGKRKRIVTKDGCWYCQALNKENAEKKFKKHYEQVIREQQTLGVSQGA